MTSDEQVFIVTKLGEFKQKKEICKLFFEKFSRKLADHYVSYYLNSPKWREFIKKDREKYCRDMFKVEFANERRRIEKLSEIVDINFGEGNYMVAISALREIREQLQRPEAFIQQNNYQLNVFSEMTDEELRNRELELIRQRNQLKGIIDASEK